MFDAKFDGRAFDRALDGLDAKLRRPMDFMARPAEDWFCQIEREQFASQGGAGASGTWPRVSQATARQKAIEGRGTFPTLVRSGRLFNALTQPGGLRQLIEVTGDKIVFHLPSPAGFHQQGTRTMPARKVVDPSDTQKQRLVEAVGREAAHVMEDLGLKVKR